MARKKKTEEKPLVLSKYQLAIVDFVEHGQGNVVIEAEAGSAKTTTLIECLKHIPDDVKILFTAFNTDIVSDIKKRMKKSRIEKDVDMRTLHSLGYAMLMANFPRQIDPQPNTFKYGAYIYNNIKEISQGVYANISNGDKSKYIDNIRKYVDLGRCFIAESMVDMNYIESHYNIPTISNEKQIALDVMKWGKENYQTVDFTDMVWLPNVLNCKPYKFIYDWILLDEAQDVSKAERELVLRCTKMSTRMLIAGQKIQSLYSFQGIDCRSFDALKALPNTISLPLSISYRCAKNIVKLANRFSPTMEAKEDAELGEVKYNAEIDEINDGDMVLCRVNAPLLQMYCKLIELGKPTHILGKDIGTNLIKTIQKTKEEFLFANLKQKGVFSKLYDELFSEIDEVMLKNHISFDMALDDMNISQNYDNIQALESLSNGLVTADELMIKIKDLFSDKKQKGITLATIHKSKGLEADNVFICCPSLMPAKSAKEPWELQQESNLEYVAYTRAKKKLAFLSEDDFTMYSSNAQQRAANLQAKKAFVFALHGRDNRCSTVVPSLQAAKHIIANSTNVHTKPKKTVNISAGSTETDTVTLTKVYKSNSKKRIKRRIKI